MTRAVRTRDARQGEWVAAAVSPVARVVVDVPLAHLDRPFDYRVPAQLDDDLVPGVRVRVRFSGRLVDGYVLERVAESEHDGRLAWVDKVVSSEPTLTPEVAALCRGVADRYGGVLADVLRLAVPPRHARVEREVRPAAAPAQGPVAEGSTPDPAERPMVEPAEGSTVGPAEVPAGGAVGGAVAVPAVGTAGEPPGGAAGTPGSSSGWARYPRGPAFLTALEQGRAAHAVWQALPGEDAMGRLAEAAATVARRGRGALLVVPDRRDVEALHAACGRVLGPEAVVALTAELGPAERYRRWLAVRRGQVRVVVGTRAAAFAPVADLGLLAVWDDGDDLHAEPRAPYPHVRDVLVLRAHQVGAALLLAGFARTAEGQLLVDTGWAQEIVAGRATVRAAMPRVAAQADSEAQLVRDPRARAARLPAAAFDAARASLAAGRPVLVQVPRAGYVPWLACAQCREPARCRHCAGPLEVPHGRTRQEPRPRQDGTAAPHRNRPDGSGPDGSAPNGSRPNGSRPDGTGSAPAAGLSDGDGVHPAPALPRCRWCGRTEPAFRCGACGSHRLRAGVIGADRTAEELGRAFPGVAVRSSGGGAAVVTSVPAGPAIVVATPGAEPRAVGGYGAALLLDGWALLARPDLRVAEETLRRWLGAATLVVPHGDGGRVLVMADAALAPVQALVRWDPAGHAAAELAARSEVGFPPAWRLAAVEGPPAALAELLDGLPDGIEVLGPVEIDPPETAAPVPVATAPAGGPPRSGSGASAPAPTRTEPDGPRERALLRVPRGEGRTLAAVLHAAQAARSARKALVSLRVRLDPPEIG